MQPQVHNQGQPLPMTMSANQSQARQKNIPSNMGHTGVQSSASLTSRQPPVSGLSQTSIPNGVAWNPTVQNISGVSPSSTWNSMGQGVLSNMFANPQYEPTSQQSSVQTSSVMQPSMIQSANLSALQQNQRLQSLVRQQQQQLMALEAYATNMDQNYLSSFYQQLLGSQSNVSALQQQETQQNATNVLPAWQQLLLQPTQLQPNQVQRDMQPQSSIRPPSSETGNSNGGDLQEEVREKVKAMKHTSLSSLSGGSTSQHNMMNSLQPASSLEGNIIGSLQQTGVGSLQQNTVSGPQQANVPLRSIPSNTQMQKLLAQMQQMQMQLNELKMRQGTGVKPGSVFQQQGQLGQSQMQQPQSQGFEVQPHPNSRVCTKHAAEQYDRFNSTNWTLEWK